MYTNRLLAELKIQTVYKHNARRRTIKIYAGIATLGFVREPLARKQEKCKNDVSDTSGNEHTPSHEHDVRISAVPITTCEMAVNIQH